MITFASNIVKLILKIMKISLKRFAILSSLLLLSLAWFITTSTSVLAAVPQYGLEGNDTAVSQVYGSSLSSSTDPRTIAANLINITLTLLGVIVVSLIIFSGYQWMTSNGDEKVIDTAKKRMANAVIGLVIILAAWGISVFIMNKLTGAI